MTAGRPDDESRRLHAAVIGCGPIGRLHAESLVGCLHAELVAVCDLEAERRDEAARQFGVPAFDRVATMLADARPEVVTIATPDHAHLEPTLEAIAAGCHVFCEKPLAASVAEAETMVRAAAERQVRLGVDYNRRFAFGYRTAKRLLLEGAIGRVRQCRIAVSDRTPPAKVARHPLVMFTTLLTHHFDLLRHYGGAIRTLAARAGHEPVGPLLRRVTLEFELAGGARGTIESDYQDELAGTQEQMELEGSEGTIVVAGVTGPVRWTGRDGRSRSFAPEKAETFYDSLAAHVRAFVESTARGDESPVGGADGLAGLRLAAAAEASIRSAGGTIEVNA